jgi:NADPH-ferrihemoprotein reductase
MIGAGTGLAPFRGFVQERPRVVELGKPVGKMLLFFGCRSEGSDFLYRKEWDDWKKELGEKFEIVTAFSRTHGKGKAYVQRKIREEAKKAITFIDEGAAVYICGEATIAREVRKALVNVLAGGKGMDEGEVDRTILAKMKKAGLYQEDVWD